MLASALNESHPERGIIITKPPSSGDQKPQQMKGSLNALLAAIAMSASAGTKKHQDIALVDGFRNNNPLFNPPNQRQRRKLARQMQRRVK